MNNMRDGNVLRLQNNKYKTNNEGNSKKLKNKITCV